MAGYILDLLIIFLLLYTGWKFTKLRKSVEDNPETFRVVKSLEVIFGSLSFVVILLIFSINWKIKGLDVRHSQLHGNIVDLIDVQVNSHKRQNSKSRNKAKRVENQTKNRTSE
ncbi:MAG: hypothetical protein CL677_08630 [Bdellovibrionaceae bacterium]|nr:hypothetical protein [Pseudobdellovibrionaceae bacterium]|tara:strand:- start:1034 stop:1372 length:339 start_codon:yes stop_codon:yes gene_type:complete